MAAVRGRVLFPGNPWPAGHRVTACAWTARIDRDARLWFGLELRSEDYDAAPPALVDDSDDWRSPLVWRNYHAFSVETHRGVLAAEPGRPFAFAAAQTLAADPVDGFAHDAEHAFGAYLLGHDTIAGHALTFTPGAGGHGLRWTGLVALTYGGDEEFRHRFRIDVLDLPRPEIALPAGTAPATAREWLTRLVDEPERFAPDATGMRFTPV